MLELTSKAGNFCTLEVMPVNYGVGPTFFCMFSCCWGFFCTFWITLCLDPCSLACGFVCARLRAVTNSSEPALHPHPSLQITVISEPPPPPRPGRCCSPAAVGTPRLLFALLCSNPLSSRNSAFLIATLREYHHSSLLPLLFITVTVKLMFFVPFFLVQVRLCHHQSPMHETMAVSQFTVCSLKVCSLRALTKYRLNLPEVKAH